MSLEQLIIDVLNRDFGSRFIGQFHPESNALVAETIIAEIDSRCSMTVEWRCKVHGLRGNRWWCYSQYGGKEDCDMEPTLLVPTQSDTDV